MISKMWRFGIDDARATIVAKFPPTLSPRRRDPGGRHRTTGVRRSRERRHVAGGRRPARGEQGRDGLRRSCSRVRRVRAEGLGGVLLRPPHDQQLHRPGQRWGSRGSAPRIRMAPGCRRTRGGAQTALQQRRGRAERADLGRAAHLEADKRDLAAVLAAVKDVEEAEQTAEEAEHRAKWLEAMKMVSEAVEAIGNPHDFVEAEAGFAMERLTHLTLAASTLKADFGSFIQAEAQYMVQVTLASHGFGSTEEWNAGSRPLRATSRQPDRTCTPWCTRATKRAHITRSPSADNSNLTLLFNEVSWPQHVRGFARWTESRTGPSLDGISNNNRLRRRGTRQWIASCAFLGRASINAKRCSALSRSSSSSYTAALAA